MDQNNPYQPIDSTVAIPDAKLLGTWQICALVLISLQTGLFALSSSSLLQNLRAGEVGLFTFFFSFLAIFFLVLGGIALFYKSRFAIYVLAMSAVIGVPVMLQSSSPLAITGTGIAFIATLISIRTSNQKSSQP